MPDPVALFDALATFDEPRSPRIIARYNGNEVFLAKALTHRVEMR